MKKLLNKKNIIVFSILTTSIIIFYLVYGSMNQKINETYFYVVFDTNGGSRIPVAKVKINEVATAPEPPTKKGYKFKYWTLDNKEYDFTTKVRNNITLFANWEAEEKEVEEANNERQGTDE